MPVTRISTTPAPASTPRHRFGGTPSCSHRACSGTRIRPAPPRLMRRASSSDRVARCSTGSTPATTTPRSSRSMRPVHSSTSASRIRSAPGGRLLLTVDNHNSVNGIREFAVARGASVSYAPLTTPELRIDRIEIDSLLKTANRGGNNLFAFPGSVQLLGREASAGARRRSPREWMGCAARCGRIRSDQSTRSAAGQSRVPVRVLLQDVRVSDRRGLPVGSKAARSRSSGVRGSRAAR